MRLFNEIIRVLVIVCILLTLAQPAAAAGFSMGCSEGPTPSAARDRAWPGENTGVSGRPGFRRPGWAGRDLSHTAPPQPAAHSRFLRPAAGIPQAPGIRVEPPGKRPHDHQPEWMERLYAKYPVQSGSGVEPPGKRSHTRKQEWVERLYAKFPVQSGFMKPAFRGRVEADTSSIRRVAGRKSTLSEDTPFPCLFSWWS